MQFCLASYWDSCSAQEAGTYSSTKFNFVLQHTGEKSRFRFRGPSCHKCSVSQSDCTICCKPRVERYVQALRLGEGDSYTFLACLASAHALHEQRAIRETASGNEALKLNRGMEHESVPSAPARP